MASSGLATRRVLVLAVVSFGTTVSIGAQSVAALEGSVRDVFGFVLADAEITVRDESNGLNLGARVDEDGRYRIAAIPAGVYTVTVDADGFRREVIDRLYVEVGRTLVRDFQLPVGVHETVVVVAEAPLIDRATTTVGDVVTATAVQQIPLNGRHFIDLAMLVPGAVGPSQTGFSTTPIRGVGALAVNIAGNREEAVGFVVNGVATNNLTFGSLIFEPPLVSVAEFKVDRSMPNPEQGRIRRNCEHRDAIGYRCLPGRGIHVPSGRRARRAQFLRAHDGRAAALQAASVRRRAGWADQAWIDVLLRWL